MDLSLTAFYILLSWPTFLDGLLAYRICLLDTRIPVEQTARYLPQPFIWNLPLLLGSTPRIPAKVHTSIHGRLMDDWGWPIERRSANVIVCMARVSHVARLRSAALESCSRSSRVAKGKRGCRSYNAPHLARRPAGHQDGDRLCRSDPSPCGCAPSSTCTRPSYGIRATTASEYGACGRRPLFNCG